MTVATRPDSSTAARGPESALPTDVPWYHLPPFIPRFLRALSGERDQGEVEIKARFESRVKAAETEYADLSKAIAARHRDEGASIAERAKSELTAAREKRDSATQALEAQHVRDRAALLSESKRVASDAKSNSEQTRWEAAALYEASMQGETARQQQFEHLVAEEAGLLADLRAEAERLEAKNRRIVRVEHTDAPISLPESDEPVEAWRTAINDAAARADAISQLRAPRMVQGGNVIWFWLVPWLLLGVPAVMQLGLAVGLIASGVSALAIGLLLAAIFWRIARRELQARLPDLHRALGIAGQWESATRAWVKSSHERTTSEIQSRRDQSVQRAEESLVAARAKAESLRTTGLAGLDETLATRRSQLSAEADAATKAAESEERRRGDELRSWFESESRRVTDERARRLEEANARHARDWSALKHKWLDGVKAIRDATGLIEREVAARSFDWHDPAARWKPPSEVPPAVRFGQVAVELARIPHGQPRDPELRAATPAEFELPALLTLPNRASLLLRATGAGKDAGVAALQAAMLRYLTSLPPGKVRFTIIDPTGLGRHFAAFMHLADYSELLVTSRIWTEPQQIEQRLADLSLHMENVIQQFLRNEFDNLEDYNRQAAEVAEPYRVLVVANFPAGFTDSSAQRLLSIMQGGPRCGVHTLLLVDDDQPIPSSFAVDDLSAHAESLKWDGDRYAWQNPDFATFPLVLDTPPADAALTPLMHAVGDAARAASRVEVPFEVIAPPPNRWWTGSTRGGIDVPLGRAGATKLQSLQLGKGTSQHVLIAGRTGSGKSTLLHALITNAALLYSPDEIEFYLIDFKKGVEFQTYAQYELPHARVIAIESEREFGLSVLQRLDEELKRRGEAFRAAGVQDLAGYRGVAGAPPLPRVLLVVDEFQEFFVDDDKLAQDSALLLDRLVRQGRAFGIHIHLGSQTLGGAYSLARTTLGQMGVRIALQCSEADAHLILSEDNAAARLLSRPGEAIYNDANGMIEGNHVFQVVWLSEQRREEYLKQIQERAAQPGAPPPRPQVVFEGNIPAELSKNFRLRALLESDGWPSRDKAAPLAWLGDAVAIKDPSAATFRRAGGNNLLVIGQDASAARGVFTAAFLSLAAQLPPAGAVFYMLDGSTEDDPDAEALRGLSTLVPHTTKVGGTREAAALLDELASELKARQDGVAGAPSTFVFLYDLSRFRDLRKAEDDFGFGRRDDAKATPAQQLAELIREGPALGIHVIAWFDTLNNVQRVFDRSALREFESRILFQMSANDSSALVDSPLANRLGAHRALFSSEDQGTLEKFRPYGVPDGAWLAGLAEVLAKRKSA